MARSFPLAELSADHPAARRMASQARCDRLEHPAPAVQEHNVIRRQGQETEPTIGSEMYLSAFFILSPVE